MSVANVEFSYVDIKIVAISATTFYNVIENTLQKVMLNAI